MATDKQRLEALEAFVRDMHACATGCVAGLVLWPFFLPLQPVMLGLGIVFLAASVWNYYKYKEARHQ